MGMSFDSPLIALAVVLALAVVVVVQAALGRRRGLALARWVDSLLTEDASAPVNPPFGGLARDSLLRLRTRLATVEMLATTDQLTAVLNRQASLHHLASELERSIRYNSPLTVGLIDIDHFKRVNDAYGHAAGDMVLRHVAQVLRTNIRSVDTLGRYGGEEFLLVLPETDVEQAAAAAEKLRRLVGRTPVTLPDGEQVAVTVSIGIAAGVGAGLRLDTMTRDADTALYAAKSLGRDQVYLFKELDDERSIQRSPIGSVARDEALAVGRLAAEAAEDRLTEILAPRDGWSGKPSEYIAELSVNLAAGLGLPDAEIRRIRTASLLHDVGKIAISEELLSKPRDLTVAEWRAVMEHPKVGHIILEQAGSIRDAANIALHHHEWFNGQGYPHGLAGDDIPLGSRIVAIADAYEAMVSSRPYKDSRSHEEALAELERCSGTQFDPQLVAIFVSQMATAPELDLRSTRTGTDG